MDNQTLYRSPVRLVSHADEPIGEFSPQTISRAKKKLLALISLSDNEMELNGLVYTKNDIISLLDGVTDETVWRHHCTVYALPGLLAFLEEAYFDDQQLSREVIANADHEFLAFLSYPFAVAFNTASGIFIRLNVVPQPAQIRNNPMPSLEPESQFQVTSEVEEFDRFAVLAALVGYERFIAFQHQYIAFERVRVYFHELLYTLRNLSWEKFQEDESVLHFVFSTTWMQFANKLPMAFSGTRDEVVDNVTNIAIRFQHKATWHYLHLLCEDLKTLECNQDLREEINRLSTHFEKNSNIVSGGNRDQKSSSPSVGRYILWGIWILLGILRMGSGCNRSSSSYEPDIRNKYYQQPDYQSIIEDTERVYAEDSTAGPEPINFDRVRAEEILDSVRSSKNK